MGIAGTGLRWGKLVSGVVMALALAACGDDNDPSYEPSYSKTAPDGQRVYLFGIHPLHNPETLYATYQPVVEYINARLGGPALKLEASRSYAAFEEKLYGRRFDIALPNSMQIANAVEKCGYHAFAKMDDDSQFCGIILVRKDSGIKTVSDLKGRAVSYPAPTALAATMLPQDYLRQNGLDLKTDVKTVYVGSQESSIMSVYLGSVAAGASWPPPWQKFQHDQPEKAAQLEVKWRTRSLPHNGFVARDDIPPEVVAKVRDILLTMEFNPEGLALLAGQSGEGMWS